MKNNAPQRILKAKQRLEEKMKECITLSKKLAALVKEEWLDSDTELMTLAINNNISNLIYQLNEVFENDGGNEL